MALLNDRLRLELKRARRPAMQYLFLVGIFAFCLTIILKNQFYDRFWQSKFEFRAQFADVKGVTPGVQRVKIAGVQAGVVSKSEVVDGRPVLTIKLDKKYGPIYKDAKLRLRPLTPLQDMYVTIESRGHKQAGVLDRSAVLAAARTESPVDISRVLNEFPLATRTRLRTLMDQFGNGLADRGDSLRSAFVELAPFLQAADQTATAVAQRRGQMARVVTNLGLLTKALGDRDKAILALVRDGNGTLASLAQADTALDATFREIPPTLTAMRGAFTRLRAAEDQLDPALSGLKPVAAQLGKGMDALKQLGVDAQPALAALQPAARRLRPLSADLKPTSESLQGALMTLRPQARAYDRITGEFDPCLDQLGNFFNDTLSVLKFADAYGAYPRGDDRENVDTVGALMVPGNEGRSPTCVKGSPK